MAKQIVFEKDAFVGKVRSDVITLESKVEKYLADIMQKEAKSKVDDSFKNTLAKFKASIDVYSTAISTTSTKVSFPEEVYKVLLAGHAVKYAPQIKKIDGTLIKEMEAYIADILGTGKTVTTADGKSYEVDDTFAQAGLATVTYDGRRYILNWRSDSAKESLYSLLRKLETWGQNFESYFFNELKKDALDALLGTWVKALLSKNKYIAEEVYDSFKNFLDAGGDATNIPLLANDNFSKWLSDLTKKRFPDTNKEIAALQEKYKKLDDLARDTDFLKDYKADPDSTADAIKNTVTGLTGYKKFLKAYNDLQTALGQSASNFDSIIPNYIGYEISNEVSDTFSENNATITCADGDNEITITGSNVKVDTGRGNDTIQSGSYSESNSKVKIHSGDGDDEIYNYSSDSTLDGGAGADFIRSDSKGTNVSISGGDGSDTIDSHGNHNIIDGGAGNDSISNYGDNVTISGDGGADTIRSYGSDSSVFGGAGDDELLVMSSYVDGGTGSDTISIQGSYVTAYGGGSFDYLPTKDVFNIASGASNVYINDFEFGDVLNLPAGNYTARIEFGSTAIRDSSSKLIVWLKNFTERLENFTYDENGKQTSDGDDSINNDISNIKIDLGAGNDTIRNSGNNVTISGGAGDDFISNGNAAQINVDGGNGNNTVYGGSTIKTGSGDDYVSIYDGSVDAGEGNNTVYSSSKTTVETGNGDDFVSVYGGLVDAGEGNNTIYASNATTIKTGDGDDYISLYGGGLVEAGEGNNTVIASTSGLSVVKVTVKTGSSDDYISIGCGSIDADEGNNTVHAWGEVTVKTDSGDDYVSIRGGSINAGDGNNTIYVRDDCYATVKTGAGDDSIYIFGGSINAGEGNNTIYASYYATIKTGAGDDYIDGCSSIDAGEGNNTVYASSKATVKTGSGNDYIYGGSSIEAGDGNNTVYGYDTIKTGSGDDFIDIFSSGSVNAGEGNNIISGGYNVTVKTYSGEDFISIFSGSIDAGEGNNTVVGSGTIKTGSSDDFISIYSGLVDAGEGNNTVYSSSSSNITIKTGSGDDFVSIRGGSYSINAGKGNDFIGLYSAVKNNVVEYSAGDGNDTIWGFDSTSTLFISGGEYTRSTVGNDIIIKVGDGSITLKNAKGKTLNIEGKEEINLITEGTESGERLENSNDNQTILAKGGDDTVMNWGSNVSLDADGGNDSIYSDGSFVTITAGTGNDTVNNWGANTSIFGGSGNDTVLNQGASVLVDTGTDDGFIQNTGANATLTATDGKNFFANGASSVTIGGGSDSDTVHNQGAQVSIDSGAGNDSIQNAGSDVKIEMAGGNDVIENFASSVTIGGGDDDDTIGNWTGSDNVSIDGGAGNDSIYNNGGNNVTLGGGAGDDDISNFYTNVTIDGGDDSDTIYNNAATVSITGGEGNDSIYNEGNDVTLEGGGGSDTITNKATVYKVSGGGTKTVSPDNVSINGGDGDDSLINTGGDNVELGGGKNVSMTGGKGNDTLTGSSQAEVFVYEAGNDVITNYSGEDTVKIAAGSIDSVSVDDTDLIFKIGDGSLTLKNMQDRYITVTDADGNTTTQTYGSTGYSAQEAIINLVNAWNKTFLKDTAKLDEAIKLSTPFNSTQEVIDQMVADCRAAGDADTFLRKYCGIIRDNADTGAITGWDAGGASIKSGDDIVGETLPATQVPDYTNTTFTARNLTINIASSGSSLNATGKKVLDGIYSWWANEAVRLIEESYKLSFSDGDSIRVEMVPSASYAGNTSSTGVVKFNQDNAKFDGDDDYNGNGMDKTVAHEFTHVAQYKLMGGSLPQFLMEGLADLTAGIDDGSDTKNAWLDSLGGSADSLASYLDLDNDGTGTTPYYVAGYMFYRYLARQAALNYDAAQNYAFKDGSAISGTDGDDLLTGSGSNVSISGGNGNDTVTAYGDGMKVQGDAGDDTIYNSGNNVVFGYADGDGNDSIVGFNDTSTLQIAADDFNTSKSGNNVIVTVGGGKITLSGAASLNTVNIVKKEETDLIIKGTEGADSLSNTLDGATIQALGGNDSINNFGSSVSIDGGAGDDLISIGGSNNLIRYAAGDGNDTISGFNDTSTLSIGSAYSSAVSGDDIVLTVGDGKITLTGAAGLDTLNIVGGAQGDAELATSLVGAMLYRTEAGYPVIAGLALNPEVYHSDEPDNYAAKETWTIESSDGLELSGVHYTPENSNDKWVVIIHGYGHNHKHMWPFLGFYLENGYNVLMVDQRAAGDSEGEWLTMGAAESADIALWTQEIARRNPNSKITLFGASMGAATAMLAAARNDTANVTSLVEDCGYTNVVKIINRFNDLIINTDQETIDLMPDIAESLTGYNLKDAAPIDSIAAVTVPSLFISGNDDSVVPVSMLSDLYDASGADVKETFIVDGAGHGKAGLEDPVGYSNAVFRFLAEANEEGWETENIVDGISLRGTSYNDTITNSGASVTLNTGAGDDSITNTGDNVLFLYAAGDGNDTIQNFNETATLSIGDGTGSYSKETLDGDVIITVGDGKVTLTGAASLDTLNIAGTEANASIINASSGTLVTGTANNDTIVNSGASVTIDALAGDDYIHNDQDGYSASISGGDGNDTIINDGNLSTVNGGKGDDYIDVYSGSIGGGGFIEYAAGDGFDTVVGYMAEDGVMDYRLQITGSTYTSAKSGNDVVLGVGEGSITLKDAAQAAEWNGIDIVGTLEGVGISVNNTVDNTTIGGTIYDDTISNSAEYVVINALGGTDIITNSAGNVAIFAGDDADVINNGAGNVTIDAGDGNDVIGTTGSNVSIVGGDGDNSVDNQYGHDSTISTGDGSDTVNSYNSNNVSISAGAGNDYISNSGGSSSTINAGAGDDSIDNSGSGALINAGMGDDSISNSGTLVTLNTGAGNDSIIDNTGSSVTVDMGAGDDYIFNTGSNVSINGGGDADTLYNGGTKYPGVGSYTLRGGDSVTLAGGDGDDFISNLRGDSVSMDGGAGDDTISNSGDYVTITALEGNNEISNGGGAEAKGGNNSSIITGDGNDSIRVHNADNVTIDAGGGDDYITSARYNNSVEVHAGTGNDTIGGLYSHYSTLDGGDGNDFISDYSDNSSLVGGAGNDTISVSSGSGFGNNLTINGGTGDDLITISGSNNLIQYTAGDGNDSISGFRADSTLSIGGSAYSSVVSGDDLILTVGTDSITLTGAASLNTVNILGTLSGDDAKTTTYDDSDAPKVTLGSSIETGDATARTKSIRIMGNNLDNSIVGGSGKDTLYGKNGDDYLEGGAGNDKLYGQNDNDTLWGGEGNDTLWGGNGSDLFIYTAGKDVITDFDEDDTLQIGDGTDTYSTRISGDNVILTVGEGKITLKDAASLSTLNILGEEQAPTTNYDDDSAARVTLGSSIEIGDATARTKSIRIMGNNIANTILGGAGKDTLYGKNGDDYLEGGAGNDKLYGQNDNDTLWGGEGNDTLSGGNGSDLFIYTAGKDVITDFDEEDTLQLGDGSDTYSKATSGDDIVVTVGDGRVTLKDAAKLSTLNILGEETALVETYTNSASSKVTLASNVEVGDATARTKSIRIMGNNLDNSIVGGSGKDTLYGKNGDDYLEGGAGNDKLYGQNDNDTLWGGEGNDTLSGGNGDDLFIYTAGKDVITDFDEEDTLQLGDGSDTYSKATSGDDIVVTVGEGRVTLKDAAGLDTLNILGEEAALVETYTNSASSKVTLASNIEVGDATARTKSIRIMGNNIANTILGGTGKDTLYGKNGDDYLEGGAGNDNLYGQNDNDTLWGGDGNDTLSGGNGADTFIYNDGEGRDVITDFGDDDLLQITGDFTTSYNASAGTITFKFDDGRLTLQNVTASGTFNINGDAYHISGKTLVK